VRLKNKPLESLFPVNMKDIDELVNFTIIVVAFIAFALWAFAK
jgi:hypothetical protein